MPLDPTIDADPSERFAVSIANAQCDHPVDGEQLIEAVVAVLRESTLKSATISLAVVDDRTIHELNRRYLDHDWPTDVLSFALDERDGHLEGEIILSAETAAAEAAEFGWPAAAEQLMYVIHGALHLVGYGDKTPDEALAMRIAEGKHLRRFGIDFPHHSRSSDSEARSSHTAGWEGGQGQS